MGNNKAIILQNHGLLTVGHSVDEAAWWFISMERSCQAQLLAQAAGNPISLAEPLPWRIDPKTAAFAHQQVGSHAIGWFNFQSLYEMIVYQQPELLG